MTSLELTSSIHMFYYFTFCFLELQLVICIDCIIVYFCRVPLYVIQDSVSMCVFTLAFC